MDHLKQPSKDVANAAAEPHPRIAELIRHWRSLAPGPGLLPGRRHFDPMKVPKLLPNIWLLEIVPGPPRRYRRAAARSHPLVTRLLTPLRRPEK